MTVIGSDLFGRDDAASLSLASRVELPPLGRPGSYFPVDPSFNPSYDPAALVAELRAFEVPFVVIGSAGADAWGIEHSRPTDTLEIVVADTPAARGRLIGVLRGTGAYLLRGGLPREWLPNHPGRKVIDDTRIAMKADLLDRLCRTVGTISFASPFGVVDVTFASREGVDFRAISRAAEDVPFGERTAPVAALHHLAQLALADPTPIDYSLLPALTNALASQRDRVDSSIVIDLNDRRGSSVVQDGRLALRDAIDTVLNSIAARDARATQLETEANELVLGLGLGLRPESDSE